MPSDDVAEFGGWPQPPRWVWAIAGVAAAAVLAGLVVARSGPHHAAASSRSMSPATAPVRALRPPGAGTARWPSAAGACGLPVYLPQIHVARHHAHALVRVLVGGTALRQVTTGGAVSGPLPGLPHHGRLVTTLVAGPGAGYAVDVPCSSSSASPKVYRIVAGTARPLGITADALLGGPRQAWAVTYLPRTVLTPMNGGRAVTLKPDITPVADTAAGLVAVVYHPPAGRRVTVELVDPDTGAVLRRLGDGAPLGAAGHVALVSLPDCGAPLAPGTCTLETIDLTTGRPTARFKLPAGRVPVSGAVFSPDSTQAAFQLARARLDRRLTTELGLPPSDVAVLHLGTGRLDLVPGLTLPPEIQTGLAFDATGSWLLATVSEGNGGELLAWRHGMPGPALLTSLPGPLADPPPLLAAPSWWRTG